MTTSADRSAPEGDVPTLLPGVAVTAVTPDDATVQAAAMLIVLLVAEGANVAAMVPVETGLDDPCEAGSRGSLVRWAAGHMDDPRQVTPFALEADRSAMHAADASGTLLHGAAFDRARETLCSGRSVLVVADAVGVLDPVTPSLSMLDLITRWSLGVVIVEPVNRWTVGHVRLLASALLSRGLTVTGVMLSDADGAADVASAIQDTLAVLLDCPVVLLPRVLSVHDRDELLTAARACGLHRITARIMPRSAPTLTEPTSA